MKLGQYVTVTGERVWDNGIHSRLRLAYLRTIERVEFCVKNLGYAHVRQAGSQVCLVWRPSLCSDVTLAEVLYLLGDRAHDRVMVKSYLDAGNAWSYRIFAGRSLVSNVATFAGEQMQPWRNATQRYACSGDPWALHPPYAAMIEYWKHAGGVLDERMLTELQSRILGNRYWRFHCDEQKQIRLVAIGDGMPSFAIDTYRPLVGRTFCDHPDRSYGSACIDAYIEVIERNQPVLEYVDAVAVWPRHGKMRRQYLRLLLPFAANCKETEVLCLTSPINSVIHRAFPGNPVLQ